MDKPAVNEPNEKMMSMASLPGIKELFISSWQTYSSSWKLFVWLVLLPVLATLVIILVVGLVIATILSVSGGAFTPDRIPWLIPPALVGVVLLVIVNTLGKIALIKTIEMNGKARVKELITMAWPMTGKYVLLQLLLGLVILLGLVLLIIPGLIFSVWFMFATMILVVEGVGGTAALKRSKSYVKGRFWPVVGRMVVLLLVVGVISGGLSSIDNQIVVAAVQLVSTFLLGPIATIYTFNLYQSVKSTAM